MSTAWIIVIIVGVILVGLIIALFLLGRKSRRQQEEQSVAMEKSAQTMNLFIIDKKKMRLKNANMPKIVLDAADWKTKLMRVPIVKVKVGPRVMSMVCDPDVYKTLLPGQEVKAQVSGVYINSAKRVRGPVVDPKKSKKGTESFLDKLR